MSHRVELCRVVEARIGVRLQLRSDDPILRFVHERVRELGLAGPEAYLARIARAPDDDREVRLLVRAATNGQTYFFRDEEQLHALADHFAASSRGRPIEIWCAGCATGEEPYSLVMACLERRIDVRVLATDVNDERVEHARRGLYDDLSVRHVSAETLARYFERDGNRWRLRASVTSRVELACHNLLSLEPPSFSGRRGVFDAVLCRNLFIYFARDRVEAIVGSITRVLATEGLLCLGTAESLHGHDVPLAVTPLGSRTAYRHASRVTPGRDASAPVRVALPARPSSEVTTLGTSAVLARAPSDTDRIEEALRSGAVAEAHERLVAFDPRHERWALWVSLGNSYLRAHDVDAAVACYRAASASASLEAEPSFFLGIAELKRGRVEGAREALRRAVFLEPSHWRASLLLAGTFEREGEKAAAARELAHTRACLESETQDPACRSVSDGIPAANVSREEARLAIDVRLAALERARTAEVSRE